MTVESITRPALLSDAYDARRRQLAADYATVRNQHGYDPAYQSGRRASDARILTASRGVRIVRKVSNRHKRGDAVKEHVASVVGFALDPTRTRLVTPVVITSEAEMVVEFLDGVLWCRIPTPSYTGCPCCNPGPVQLISERHVLREAFTVMRALDHLTENADRNVANFVLMSSDRVGAFDHTFAFEGRPGEAFDYWGRVNPFTRDQVDRWEANLAGLTDLLDEKGPVGVKLFDREPILPSKLMETRLADLRREFLVS